MEQLLILQQNETMQLLRSFGDRIISRYGKVNWPSRSPDLTSPDFFLWGYLKERIYVNKPENLKQLKDNITKEIRELDQETPEAVMEHVLERARMCEAENGRHLKDVIFHAWVTFNFFCYFIFKSLFMRCDHNKW